RNAGAARLPQPVLGADEPADSPRPPRQGAGWRTREPSWGVPRSGRQRPDECGADPEADRASRPGAPSPERARVAGRAEPGRRLGPRRASPPDRVRLTGRAARAAPGRSGAAPGPVAGIRSAPGPSGEADGPAQFANS